jgi:hypothetical protein
MPKVIIEQQFSNLLFFINLRGSPFTPKEITVNPVSVEQNFSLNQYRREAFLQERTA